ncbi:hypothetical protein B0H11DRAFT_2213704 [Mycena galericulata]|nr:hypothetical protein B0H11DRAFT_2213704 [Mycena galericulata]
MSVEEQLDNLKTRSAHKRRRHRACDSCRRKKRRCEGGEPCAYCVRRNSECTYGEKGKRFIPRREQDVGSFDFHTFIEGYNISSIPPERLSPVDEHFSQVELMDNASAAENTTRAGYSTSPSGDEMLDFNIQPRKLKSVGGGLSFDGPNIFKPISLETVYFACIPPVFAGDEEIRAASFHN